MTESDSGLIDQAVAEYEALRAGGPRNMFERYGVEGGRVESCGSPHDTAHWTISYVRDEDDAVLPLAIGERARCHEKFTAIARDMQFWDRRLHAPPAVIVDGARRHFRPAHGRHVVGVVEAPHWAIILVAAGESLVVVHLVGKARTILYRGRPFGLRELDVDGMLASLRARGLRPPPSPRVRPSAAIRAHHFGIVGAVEVDVGDGPSIDTVLAHGITVLEWRARTVDMPGGRRRRKGKQRLCQVLGAFLQVLRTGGGIFEGLVGEVHAAIRARCPDLDVSVEDFANVLRLLDAVGTCLVARPTKRSWRVCLSASLRDPRSDLHRRFCEEAVRLVREMTISLAAAGTAVESGATTTSWDRRATRTRRRSSSPPGESAGAQASEAGVDAPVGGATGAAETGPNTATPDAEPQPPVAAEPECDSATALTEQPGSTPRRTRPSTRRLAVIYNIIAAIDSQLADLAPDTRARWEAELAEQVPRFAATVAKDLGQDLVALPEAVAAAWAEVLAHSPSPEGEPPADASEPDEPAVEPPTHIEAVDSPSPAVEPPADAPEPDEPAVELPTHSDRTTGTAEVGAGVDVGDELHARVDVGATPGQGDMVEGTAKEIRGRVEAPGAEGITAVLAVEDRAQLFALAAPDSRCDANGGPRTKRRRPLFVPENCVALHLEGRSASSAPPTTVLATRTLAFAPVPSLQSTTDSGHAVAIQTEAHAPRGPPGECENDLRENKHPQ